jgi:flagellar basal-body rod protein FlgB
MQMLTSSMRYQTQRQTLLSQNVANLDTPGYKSRDLKPLDFKEMADPEGVKLRMATTSSKHILNNNNVAMAAIQETESFESTPSKNTVSLDQEMAKISETGVQYQMSSSLLRKYMGMYRAALGNR